MNILQAFPDFLGPATVRIGISYEVACDSRENFKALKFSREQLTPKHKTDPEGRFCVLDNFYLKANRPGAKGKKPKSDKTKHQRCYVYFRQGGCGCIHKGKYTRVKDNVNFI